ncbi:MAG TPA: hypothetical protein VMT08_12390 [Bradyrhizobium sp.]|nr:hypothetical protein [Bradyrhizobium sp.]
MTAFEMTGFGLAKPPPADSHYDLHLLSEHGGPIRSSCGLTVETEAFAYPAFDTIIVGAITALEMAPSNANLIAFVQKRPGRRGASLHFGHSFASSYTFPAAQPPDIVLTIVSAY